MTVRRNVEFALPGLALEAARAKIRVVLQQNEQLEAFRELPGEGVAFSGSATFYKKRFPNFSQRCNLEIVIRLTEQGSAGVELQLTSPPAIAADAFGQYNRFLRRVQAEIEAAAPASS